MTKSVSACWYSLRTIAWLGLFLALLSCAANDDPGSQPPDQEGDGNDQGTDTTAMLNQTCTEQQDCIAFFQQVNPDNALLSKMLSFKSGDMELFTYGILANDGTPNTIQGLSLVKEHSDTIINTTVVEDFDIFTQTYQYNRFIFFQTFKSHDEDSIELVDVNMRDSLVLVTIKSYDVATQQVNIKSTARLVVHQDSYDVLDVFSGRRIQGVPGGRNGILAMQAKFGFNAGRNASPQTDWVDRFMNKYALAHAGYIAATGAIVACTTAGVVLACSSGVLCAPALALGGVIIAKQIDDAGKLFAAAQDPPLINELTSNAFPNFKDIPWFSQQKTFSYIFDSRYSGSFGIDEAHGTIACGQVDILVASLFVSGGDFLESGALNVNITRCGMFYSLHFYDVAYTTSQNFTHVVEFQPVVTDGREYKAEIRYDLEYTEDGSTAWPKSGTVKLSETGGYSTTLTFSD